MMARVARWRVPLGFVGAAIAFSLATPSWRSWFAGLTIALVGEALRLWAAGHIEKGRGITRSGPYRLVRHPLYLGSTLLGVGFAIAAQNLLVAAVVVLYLSITLTAAMRTEERLLEQQFPAEYANYRAGLIPAASRRFSWDRVAVNREYRAVAGLLLAFDLVGWRVGT